MNPAAALLAATKLAKRADSKARLLDHLEWSRTRDISGYHLTTRFSGGAPSAFAGTDC
jgi:hypothetical protein